MSISPQVCKFSKILKYCFRSRETLGPNFITFFVGGPSYPRQIFTLFVIYQKLTLTKFKSSGDISGNRQVMRV